MKLTKEQLDEMEQALNPPEPPHADDFYYVVNSPTGSLWQSIALRLLEEVKSLNNGAG